MTYACSYEVPATVEMYQEVCRLIGDDPGEGQIAHLVVRTEQGLRHLEVWESEAAWTAFQEDRVRPAVHAVLRSVGFDEMPPEPPVEVLDVVDIQLGGALSGEDGPPMSLVQGISHAAVVTADLDRSAAFYCDVFGATLVQVDETPFGRVGIVRLGAGNGLNLFELTANSHATGLSTMFDRGHIDHFGIEVTDADNFWTLRDRLVTDGHSTGEVTDFGPVIGFDFTDPDGMQCEINLVFDPTLADSHAPQPYDSRRVPVAT